MIGLERVRTVKGCGGRQRPMSLAFPYRMVSPSGPAHHCTHLFPPFPTLETHPSLYSHTDTKYSSRKRPRTSAPRPCPVWPSLGIVARVYFHPSYLQPSIAHLVYPIISRELGRRPRGTVRSGYSTPSLTLHLFPCRPSSSTYLPTCTGTHPMNYTYITHTLTHRPSGPASHLILLHCAALHWLVNMWARAGFLPRPYPRDGIPWGPGLVPPSLRTRFCPFYSS